jgi:hypothetical protein
MHVNVIWTNFIKAIAEHSGLELSTYSRPFFLLNKNGTLMASSAPFLMALYLKNETNRTLLALKDVSHYKSINL